jgi:hypothetical protein
MRLSRRLAENVNGKNASRWDDVAVFANDPALLVLPLEKARQAAPSEHGRG